MTGKFINKLHVMKREGEMGIFSFLSFLFIVFPTLIETHPNEKETEGGKIKRK